ncbi:hypothetical protein SLA2020_098150 [Shorea laevis]
MHAHGCWWSTEPGPWGVGPPAMPPPGHHPPSHQCRRWPVTNSSKTLATLWKKGGKIWGTCPVRYEHCGNVLDVSGTPVVARILVRILPSVLGRAWERARCVGHNVAKNVLLFPYRSMLAAWGSSTHGKGRMMVVPMGSSPGQSCEWGCLAWLAWMTPLAHSILIFLAPC